MPLLLLGREGWGQLPDPWAVQQSQVPRGGSSDVGQGHHPPARMCQTLTPSLIQWQSQGSQWVSLGVCPLSSWRCTVRHCPVSSPRGCARAICGDPGP